MKIVYFRKSNCSMRKRNFKNISQSPEVKEMCTNSATIYIGLIYLNSQ